LAQREEPSIQVLCWRVLLPLPGGQGSGGFSCGRCAVVKILRFQIKREDEEETDMVFVENPSYTR